MATVQIDNRLRAPLSDEEFLAFLKQRPARERWQLIDGEPIMMNPPKLRHPDNLYVHVVAQLEVRVDVWSRRSGWQQTRLTSLDDTLDLPEFGFSMLLSRLYAGTAVARGS